jgi:nitroreductase
MDTFAAIFNRQSIAEVKTDPVPVELINKLLSAAVQAPNHYKVRPWRFVVLTGPGRERMGEVLAQSFAEKFPLAPSSVLEKERAKSMRAPLIIAVGVDQPTEPKVLEIENICAAAAAVENILLAAQSLGLAAKWRTGDDVHDPHIKQFLGFGSEQKLIAFLYIGYPAAETPPPARQGFEDRTRWIV